MDDFTPDAKDDFTPDAPSPPTPKGQDDFTPDQKKSPGFLENIRDFAINAKQKLTEAVAQKQQQAASAQASEAAFQEDPNNWTAEQFKERAPKPTNPDEQSQYDLTIKSKQDKEDAFREQYFQNKYGFDPEKQHDEFSALMSPDVKLEAMKPQSFFQKIENAVAKVYQPNTAKAANITNLSNYTGLDPQTTQKHYDQITQELGLRDYPNASELINGAMVLGLPVTVDALGPLAVAKGIAQFTAAKEGTERVVLPAGKAVWEAMNKEPVKYETGKLQDLFPEDAKDLGSISEFLLYGMGAKGIDDVISNPRVAGEIAGIRYRALKAMGINQPTALEPITYEQAQQAFPDRWKDIVSSKEWNRYKSDLSEKVTAQNQTAEEARVASEGKPADSFTPDYPPVKQVKVQQAPISEQTEKDIQEMSDKYGVSKEDLMSPTPFNMHPENVKYAKQKVEENDVTDAERGLRVAEKLASQLTQSEKATFDAGKQSIQESAFEEAKRTVLADAGARSIAQTNSLTPDGRVRQADIGQLSQNFDKYIAPNMVTADTKDVNFIKTNMPAFKDAYNNAVEKEYGTTTPNVVSADVAKTVDLPGRGEFTPKDSITRHESSSAFAKAKYDELLANQKTLDEPVLAMGGISGAGKTTSLKQFGVNLDNFAAVYDTNLRSLESASRIIDAALDTGRRVQIDYVDRDPVEAFTSAKGGVFHRFLTRPEHRLISVDGHIANYESRTVIPELAKKYANNPNVKIRVIDNNGALGEAKEVPVDKMPPPMYTPSEIKDKLNGYLDKQFRDLKDHKYKDLLTPSTLRVFKNDTGPAIGLGDGTDVAGNTRQDESLQRSPSGQSPTPGVEEPNAPPVLQSAVIPGAKEFYEKDVEPFVKGAAQGIVETAKLLTNFLDPTVSVKQMALDEIMSMKGTRDKLNFQLDRQTEKIKDMFSKMSPAENIAFIDRFKTGQDQPTPELRAVADMISRIDGAQWFDAIQYEPSLRWKEDHFRLMWKTIPNSVERAFTGIAKRPLQGSRGFLKPSMLSDMSEGLKLGGVPHSYNAMTLFKMAYADTNKFITAQKMWKRFGDMGLREFVRNGELPPANFVKLDDRIAKVYFSTPQGLATPGEWYVDEGVGRLLNNYLSRDYIRALAAGRGLLWLKNASTAVELSLSPFHAVFESLEEMGSSVGLGLAKIYNQGVLQGKPESVMSGLKDILTAPLSPYATARLGGKAIRLMSKDDFVNSPEGQHFIKKYPEAYQLLNDLFTGGGKLAISDEYRLNSLTTFKESLSANNYIGAALRVLPALNEVAFKPLFEIYIPRLKVGQFLREYSSNLVTYEKELAAGKMSRAQLARQTWRSIENRFGEMNFDNLFWNNTMKSAMQGMFRSVTWKLGSTSEYASAAGGQAKEFYNAFREKRMPRLHPSMAWLLGVSVMTVALAQIMQRTMSGKNVSSFKDAIYPQVDKMGSRVAMPTYWRDIMHLAHSPAGYLKSGLSGELGRLMDIWQNKDYYGQEVYNFADPLATKIWKIAVHSIPMPFSMSSMQSFQKSGVTGPAKYIGFAGFTRAPGYINQTPLQEKIFALYQQRFGSAGAIPKEEFQKQQVLSQYKQTMQLSMKARVAGDNALANDKVREAQAIMRQAIKAGQISPRGALTVQASSKLAPDIRAFKRLPQSDQVSLMEQMKPDELQQYKRFAAHSALREYTQNKREKVTGGA